MEESVFRILMLTPRCFCDGSRSESVGELEQRITRLLGQRGFTSGAVSLDTTLAGEDNVAA